MAPVSGRVFADEVIIPQNGSAKTLMSSFIFLYFSVNVKRWETSGWDVQILACSDVASRVISVLH